MATCTSAISSMAISTLGVSHRPCYLSSKTGSHLNASPLGNRRSLAFTRTSRGKELARRSFGTRRILASAAGDGSEEGGRATETVQKRQNGMPAQNESASIQTTGGSSKPLMRSWAGEFEDFFPTVRGLRQMLDTIDRMFDDPFLTPISQARPLMSKQLRESIRTPWDVKEEENAYFLRVEIPGFGKEHVKVRVEEGQLVIRADRGSEETGDKFSFKNYGTFSTRTTLPENVDLQKVSAELKNGVLMVTVPKMESAPKKNVIDVHVQ